VTDNDLPLFAPVPSGPPCRMVASHRGNTLAGYQDWRLTPDGIKVWEMIRSRALALSGRRISTKALVEEARAALRVEINNSHTSRIADELVARYPHLLSSIERRTRKSA
jgi:hypothetical protein